MGFDLQNFGIGLITGWASAYGIYRARHQISQAVQATRSQAASAQNFATRSADSRYINDLTELCEHAHLAGKTVKLTDILVEPRFLRAPELAAPPDDDVIHSVFHIVPHVHDHPYLHAVYNLETLSIDDLAMGDPALALLGLPGSGRTTALLTIALRSLGQVRFLQTEDHVQTALDAQEAALSDKERAARVQERMLIEERAKERLQEEHGMTFESNAEEKGQRVTAPLFNRLMPVYIHLADITLSPDEFGSEIDPAEPLVRAVQGTVSRITAGTLPRNLYKRLSMGQVLLLVDGYDDLPPTERDHKMIWLRQFMNEYNKNFFVVAGPAQGYGALTGLGLAPVFMRPWDDADRDTVVQRWADSWPRIAGTGRRSAPPPTEALLERARANNRALSPVDLTLKVWSTYADDSQAPGYEGWLRAFIARHLPKEQSIGVLLPQMAQVAALQLNEGFITLKQLEALTAGGGLDASMAALLDDLNRGGDEEEAAPEVKGKKDKKTVEEVSAQGKFLNILRRSGLLVSHRGGRLQFRHAFVAAYLASLTLKDPQVIAAKALNPAWSQALAYAGMHTSIETAIKARLNAPVDILQSHLLEMSRWLAYSGAKAEWGGGLLKQIGNILIAPNQYPLLRERAAAALISTRDKKTLFVFRQAARSANAHVRLLACLGMGAIGEAEAIADLVPLLQDKDTDVQMAAGMALGAIGTEEALEEMVIALTEGSDRLRQAVAESLAAIPDEGQPVLFDAISHEDMPVRRASAFGLRRLKSTWSAIALYKTFLEDDQWYVRSAAQQALQDVQEGERRGPRAYPSPQQIAWLAEWAAARGEGIPPGEAGTQILITALQQGEPELRLLSARVLGQTGKFNAAKALYATLRDRQEEVRAAGHRALADLETQLGKPLPAPI